MWGIELQRESGSGIPLSRQIYQQISRSILDGVIPPYEALPSTRELARTLGVSRHTVSEAYDMLLAEGYVCSRQGAPTRVVDGLRLERAAGGPARDEDGTYTQAGVGAETAVGGYAADFKTGQPDLRRFPKYVWTRLQSEAFSQLALEGLGYGSPDGYEPLRKEIAAWLFRSRGIRVPAGHIFVTAGATQALNLLADLLHCEGKEFVIEDPCHPGILNLLRNRGFKYRPAPVDEHGLVVEGAEALFRHGSGDGDGGGISAVYVTPSHQFPLGGILPASRRIALLRLARENSFYVIEDDYDCEFRYGGAPITPLYALDPERVIYVGTFSKSVFPSLRLGFAILPEPLHRRWRFLRMYADVQCPIVEQAALAEFLRTRKMDRHVSRLRKTYGRRREVLLEAVERRFGRAVLRVWGDNAGLHLALQFAEGRYGKDFSRKARKEGIRLSSVNPYSIARRDQHMDKLLLGYGHLEPEEIHSGIDRLHDFWHRGLPWI